MFSFRNSFTFLFISFSVSVLIALTFTMHPSGIWVFCLISASAGYLKVRGEVICAVCQKPVYGGCSWPEQLLSYSPCTQYIYRKGVSAADWLKRLSVLRICGRIRLMIITSER